ncbi:MAG: acetyl/propionyl/methylcrotonyl-CoA carboxylase subunit alpha [Acidimicrobiales bacterium]
MVQIRRLLVANRGEIARRIIQTAHDMGIETVAVHAEDDADAPFVAEAGSAVALAGRSATDTYLNMEALLAAADRTRADAVHPGYGFLAESAGFARAVRDAGLIFVGPPADAIALLGDKLQAKRQMIAAGVPVLESVEVAAGGDLPAGLGGLEFPVMVKAAAGGGGKGMRVVRDGDDLAAALAAAAREAKSAFGDDRLFVEPFLANARHIEIQILGDAFGNLVHLGERECSIQRRHQKIIEEAPSSGVSPELREEMGEAAVRAARSVGYENAGTVEFLLGDDGRYFFLEVNTRLQVEHPVTEAVTGIDLVREQLLVAGGAKLSLSQDEVRLSGHAIEARLYAEDPEHGFLPAAGQVEVWREAVTPQVRYDSGVVSGSVVGVEFDPMLAKVIAHAPTRSEAASRLALALERTAVHGVVTNREFLVSVLRDEAFLAGQTSTSFLEDRSIPPRILLAHGQLELAAIAAALSSEAANRRSAGVLSSLPSGWRMSAMPPEQRRYRTGANELTVEYRRLRSGDFHAVVRGAGDDQDDQAVAVEHLVSRHGTSPELPDLAIDGLRPGLLVERAGERVWVTFETGAAVELAELPRFPEREQAASSGALVAPMPGTVLSVHAAAGEDVEAGQLLVIVEAMKMEHRITAPVAGRIRQLQATTGSQVATGDLLVALDPADASDSAASDGPASDGAEAGKGT